MIGNLFSPGLSLQNKINMSVQCLCHYQMLFFSHMTQGIVNQKYWLAKLINTPNLLQRRRAMQCLISIDKLTAISSEYNNCSFSTQHQTSMEQRQVETRKFTYVHSVRLILKVWRLQPVYVNILILCGTIAYLLLLHHKCDTISKSGTIVT